MEADKILMRVHDMEDTLESITKTTEYLAECYLSEGDDVPKGALTYYLDELTKYILNWIGKGEDKKIALLTNEIDRILSMDPEFNDPFEALSYKKKFAGNLSILYDVMNLYIDSDLELKDHQNLMDGGRISERLREVLLEFFDRKRRLNMSDLINLPVYKKKRGNVEEQGNSEALRKYIDRDLKRLINIQMVRKVTKSSKKIFYETTPRANFYRNEIIKCQTDEEVLIRPLEIPSRKKTNALKDLEDNKEQVSSKPPVESVNIDKRNTGQSQNNDLFKSNELIVSVKESIFNDVTTHSNEVADTSRPWNSDMTNNPEKEEPAFEKTIKSFYQHQNSLSKNYHW